jgi:invasion protein IalB
MLNKLSASSLIFCLALAAAPVAYAETLNAPSPDTTAPEEAAPQADPNAAQVFGLWQVRCADTGRCIAATSLANKDPEGKVRKIVEVRISSNEGKRDIVVHMQSGVLIRPGIEVMVGDQVAKLEYTMCNRGFCVAGAPLSEEMYTALKKSDVMKAAVVIAPSAKKPDPQKIEFTFKLDGSGDALKAIESN